MNPISMAFGAPMLEPMSRVMMDATAKMTEMSDKMLKVGSELKLMAGKEAGKGQLLDMVA